MNAAVQDMIDYPTRVRIALENSVRHVGEEILSQAVQERHWEGRSTLDGHVVSRMDLLATGKFIASLSGELIDAGIDNDVSYINEEVPLLPRPMAERPAEAAPSIEIILDPVDGSKAVDSFCASHDLRIPNPPSAICVSAKFDGRIIAGALFCFDTRQTMSIQSVGGESYIAFVDNQYLTRKPARVTCGAQSRVIVGDYANRAVGRHGRLKLALDRHGLKGFYGGATGSSAMDIVGVVRGSFAGYIDVRALRGLSGKGAHLKWYDVSAAAILARTRGLTVLLADRDGQPALPDALDAFDPIAIVVVRAEHAGAVVSVIRDTIFPDFLRSGKKIASLV